MKKMYMESFQEICPKDMNLAIVEYETQDDIQLNFYTKEYLDKKPVYKNSASTVIFKSDKELGINGLRSRGCMLKPVKKDFYDSIDCELFSWYRKITG